MLVFASYKGLESGVQVSIIKLKEVVHSSEEGEARRAKKAEVVVTWHETHDVKKYLFVIDQ